MKPPNKFKWKAPHHIYLGAFLIFLSYLSWDLYNISKWYFLAAGIFIFLDDLIEHTITRDTPLRWFFNNFNFWLK